MRPVPWKQTNLVNYLGNTINVCSESFQKLFFPFPLLLNVSPLAVFECEDKGILYKPQVSSQLLAAIYRRVEQE